MAHIAVLYYKMVTMPLPSIYTYNYEFVSVASHALFNLLVHREMKYKDLF